jgi:hypothetical protein
MGDSMKRWMAGLGAAAVVVAIAVIVIGRIERKPAPAISPPQSAATPKPAPAPTHATASQPIEKREGGLQAEQQGEVNTAELRNESAGGETARGVQKPPAFQGLRVVRSAAKIFAPHQGAPMSTSQPSPQTAQRTQETGPPQAAPPSPPDVAAAPVQTAPAATATPAAMQVSLPSGLLKTTGSVSLNGVFTTTTSLVYDNCRVATPGQNGALLTGAGNAIALGPNAQLTAKPNEYMLDSGSSRVNTRTGWKAKIKDWTVQPVNPNAATQYEVNWESEGVYVYARVQDVDLISPLCKEKFHLEEGKAVKIPDLHRCAIIWMQNDAGWSKYVMAGGIGAATIVAVCLARQQAAMSSEGFCR